MSTQFAPIWNNASVDFSCIKANVTDTNSGSNSTLLDLQVGGSSKFKIQKNGLVILSGNPFIGTSSTVGYGINGDGSPSVVVNGSERMSVSANRLFLSNDANFGIAFSAGAAYQNDTVILRDGAAHTLAMRYGNIAQTFRLYGTHTDSNNYRRLSLSGTTAGAFTINAEGAGTGASGNTLELQTGGTTRLDYGISLANNWGSFSNTSAKTGFAISNSNTAGASAYQAFKNSNTSFGCEFGFWNTARSAYGVIVSDSGYLYANTPNGFSIANDNGPLIFGTASNAAPVERVRITTGGLVTFGGTTSSFPAIKRNGTAINFRLADDSADCDVSAAHGTFSAGTDTVSTPILNLSQTWNNAATTFTGILANVTDTASNAASLLMDLQVGSVSKVSISKIGGLQINGPLTAGSNNDTQTHKLSNLWAASGNSNDVTLSCLNNSGTFITFKSSATFQQAIRVSNLEFGTSADTILVRDAAGTLAQRNGINGQTFRIYNTTDSGISNYERGKLEWSSNVLKIGTEKAGTGSARALELQTDGTTRLTIGTTGNTTLANGWLFFEDGNSYITRTSGSNTMSFSASGGTTHASLTAAWFTLNNNGVLGGDGRNITFRAIDRGGNSGAGLTATLRGGNGSWATTGSIGGHVYVFGGDALGTGNNNGGFVYIDGGLNTGSGSIGDVVIGNTRGNLQLADARNMIVGTTTGTKIGTATNQKIGFYNATPVVQPTAVADATDAASVITQLNALLSRMRDLGLIAT